MLILSFVIPALCRAVFRPWSGWCCLSKNGVGACVLTAAAAFVGVDMISECYYVEPMRFMAICSVRSQNNVQPAMSFERKSSCTTVQCTVRTTQTHRRHRSLPYRTKEAPRNTPSHLHKTDIPLNINSQVTHAQTPDLTPKARNKMDHTGVSR